MRYLILAAALAVATLPGCITSGELMRLEAAQDRLAKAYEENKEDIGAATENYDRELAEVTKLVEDRTAAVGKAVESLAKGTVNPAEGVAGLVGAALAAFATTQYVRNRKYVQKGVAATTAKS